MTIFDFVNASEISVFYNTRNADRGPFFGETLWRTKKQLDITMRQIKAVKGKPVVIKASAYNVQAVPRLRATFDARSFDIPYFKESMDIDEIVRKELNKVIATGNREFINLVLNEVYNDPATLIDAARARREQMRMMLLTTGAIEIESNGQNYSFDFGIPEDNKRTASKNWADPTADILGDIVKGKQVLNQNNALTPERGVVNEATWNQILKNERIAKGLFPLGNVADLTTKQVQGYIKEICGVSIAVYNDSYIGDDGTTQRYIPDGTASFFPSGYLGESVFATTPQEDDLMSGSAANVAIVDTGVSVTTVKRTDPVNVETIVAQTFIPSFPVADSILIIDTVGA